MPEEIEPGVWVTDEIPWYHDDGLKADIMADAGGNIADHWIQLTQEPPPADLWGKISWLGGVGAQLIISIFTFPIGLAGFILEESLQSWGFAAFMLWQAQEYQALKNHIENWKDAIEVARNVRNDMGAASPIIFGAVTSYIQASAVQAVQMKFAADSRLLKQAETDEKARQEELDRMNYGEVRLTSSPTGAEIYINGENLQKLTPETLEKMPVGRTVFELAKYNTKTEDWDILVFEVIIEAGRRKEIHARIPKGITGGGDEEDPGDVPSEPILPLWIAAEVEGEYAIDGDTFITSKNERIRILGIDAPEVGRPFYEESKVFMSEQVEDKTLQLKIMTTKPLDVYGRTLAVVKNYKGNVAVLSLSDGLSRVDILDESPLDRTRYDAAEATAKTRKVGIWGDLP